MGNKLCKKKTDASPPPAAENTTKTPTAFDRIISKFSSPKQKWKSDTNLEEKQVNSYQVNVKTPTKDETDNPSELLSKSSDWTDVPLVVPDRKIENAFSKNNNNEDNHTPIPPPRKKKSLRETLGSLIQYKKPVEEQLMVSKKINYKCPCCEDGFHRSPRVDKKLKENAMNGKLEKKLNGKESSSLKEVKKRKTPSIASLPNYTDFKLTVAGETDVDALDLEKHPSVHSLPDEAKKNGQLKPGGDKIDNVLTRARSFGSLLPTMLLHKMSTAKAPLAEIESDDSLGGLDDWGGLNMIEHYKPRDSSLPRPRRPKTQEELLAEIENQIEFGIEEVDAEVENPQTRKAELQMRNAEQQMGNADLQIRNADQRSSVKNGDFEMRKGDLEKRNSEPAARLMKNDNLEMRKQDLEIRNTDPAMRNSDPVMRNTNLQMRKQDLETRNTELQAKCTDPQMKKTDLQTMNAESPMRKPEPSARSRDMQIKNTEPSIRKPDLPIRNRDLQMKSTDLQTITTELQMRKPDIPMRSKDLQMRNSDPQTTKPDVPTRNLPMRNTDIQTQSSHSVNIANKKNSELNESFFIPHEEDSTEINQCTNYFTSREENRRDDSFNQTTNYIIPLEEEPSDYQNGYEHSSLMKILEKYGGGGGSDKIEIENSNEIPTSPRDKHPINDFLNAERGAHSTGVKNTITT